MTALTFVAPGEWVVVTRRGVVRRVHGSGLAWRIPVVERFETQCAEAHLQPVGVRATTRDGVPVLVLLELIVSIERPEPGTVYADPWPEAEVAIEAAISRSVAACTAAELAHGAADSRNLRLSARAAVGGLGVEVHDLVPVEVDILWQHLPANPDRRRRQPR